ncbi:MAG: hypothetical protein IK990_06735 [Ruminiclostridium sp.]|nr:hypothetical protein [Ruminiclostridium sp.]MBP3855291.1 hypothetical protein [Ruminiclostridium sp.]
MNTFTVSFFGHRQIDRPFEAEERLEKIIRELIRSREYVEFLVGRNGEFDQMAASTVRRVKKAVDDTNSALVLVLPYMTAEYSNNKASFEDYYDEIEVFDSGHFRSAFGQRNRSMVDRSDLVICCIERDEGGAYETVKYARKNNKKILNVAYRAEMQERLDRVFDNNNDDKTQS